MRGSCTAPYGFDSALGQPPNHPIGLLSNGQVVRHHDYSELLLGVQGSQDLHDFVAGRAVEVAGRLVGQQHLGAGDQSPRNGGPLHFTSRKLAWLMTQAMPQTGGFEQLRGPGDVLLAMPAIGEQALSNHQRRKNILQRREFGEQVVELENHAERLVAQRVAFGRRQVVDPSAAEMHLAAVGRVERAQQVQKRALARAALADDRQELAPADFEIDTPQHRNLDVSLAVAFFQLRRPQPNGSIVDFDMRRETTGVRHAGRATQTGGRLGNNLGRIIHSAGPRQGASGRRDVPAIRWPVR